MLKYLALKKRKNIFSIETSWSELVGDRIPLAEKYAVLSDNTPSVVMLDAACYRHCVECH
jgi:hypothetical protein